MKILGIERTTFIDFPGKIACTIFLYGCNFRCGFCHNPGLVLEPDRKEISQEEIFEFLEKRKGQLEGVCITGGEPFMSLDLDFVKKIKELGYFIKIDTNGSFPEKLKEFIEKGFVDFIAMDIKSSRENYLELINSKIDLENIEKSIGLINSSGIDYEFRTTILENLHNEEEIRKMGFWLNKICNEKPKKFVLQRFKNRGKLIDEKFEKVSDTSLEFLKKLENVAQNYFKKVLVIE